MLRLLFAVFTGTVMYCVLNSKISRSRDFTNIDDQNSPNIFMIQVMPQINRLLAGAQLIKCKSTQYRVIVNVKVSLQELVF